MSDLDLTILMPCLNEAESVGTCVEKAVRFLESNGVAGEVIVADILEKQRIERARTYLERDELTLDDVAAMLGYSEQSSFGRAFKRWTGATPQRFRRNLELSDAA